MEEQAQLHPSSRGASQARLRRVVAGPPLCGETQRPDGRAHPPIQRVPGIPVPVHVTRRHVFVPRLPPVSFYRYKYNCTPRGESCVTFSFPFSFPAPLPGGVAKDWGAGAIVWVRWVRRSRGFRHGRCSTLRRRKRREVRVAPRAGAPFGRPFRRRFLRPYGG